MTMKESKRKQKKNFGSMDNDEMKIKWDFPFCFPLLLVISNSIGTYNEKLTFDFLFLWWPKKKEKEKRERFHWKPIEIQLYTHTQ